MPDIAAANRSLNTIRTELEYLRDSGLMSPPQFNSIMAQLPVYLPYSFFSPLLFLSPFHPRLFILSLHQIPPHSPPPCFSLLYTTHTHPSHSLPFPSLLKPTTQPTPLAPFQKPNSLTPIPLFTIFLHYSNKAVSPPPTSTPATPKATTTSTRPPSPRRPKTLPTRRIPSIRTMDSGRRSWAVSLGMRLFLERGLRLGVIL